MNTDRFYIEDSSAMISVNSENSLSLKLSDGKSFTSLSARRLFPMSAKDNFIVLFDSQSKEIAIIKDMDKLSKESKKALSDYLKDYYFIPKITRIISAKDIGAALKLDVETDRGECVFEVSNYSRNIKMLKNNRILIRDNFDNRYEIENLFEINHKLIDHYLL